MDFTFNDEQTAVREAVEGIFAGLVTPDRVEEVEATDDRVDRRLWAELAKADLLGLAIPTAHGGGGYGMVELCLLLEAQGKVVAPVPLWATLALGALPIAEFGSDALQAAVLPGVVAGDVLLTAALADVANDIAVGGDGRPSVTGTPTADGGLALTGTAASVSPAATWRPSRASWALGEPSNSSICLPHKKKRWIGYEMSAPMPPWRCWVAKTTRCPDSAANHEATLTDRAASNPWSRRQAACHVVTRTASVSMAASATRILVAWKVASGRPNCCRALRYSAVWATADSVTPTCRAHSPVQARSRIQSRTSAPFEGSPPASRSSAVTVTPANWRWGWISRLVVVARSMVTPADDGSTAATTMPASVATGTSTRVATWA